MFFFQVPYLAEAILRNNDWQPVVKMLLTTSQLGSFTAQDLVQYRRAWWRRGAFTAMLNWYRAALQMPPEMSGDLNIHVPTLMLWGAQDVALGRSMAQPSLDLCDEGKLVFFENTGHWVHLDEAEAVNKHLVEFFSIT
jgi:pimeloyl-ACP methyl ester carboxylesterase